MKFSTISFSLLTASTLASPLPNPLLKSLSNKKKYFIGIKDCLLLGNCPSKTPASKDTVVVTTNNIYTQTVLQTVLQTDVVTVVQTDLATDLQTQIVTAIQTIVETEVEIATEVVEIATATEVLIETKSSTTLVSTTKPSTESTSSSTSTFIPPTITTSQPTRTITVYLPASEAPGGNGGNGGNGGSGGSGGSGGAGGAGGSAGSSNNQNTNNNTSNSSSNNQINIYVIPGGYLSPSTGGLVSGSTPFKGTVVDGVLYGNTGSGGSGGSGTLGSVIIDRDGKLQVININNVGNGENKISGGSTTTPHWEIKNGEIIPNGQSVIACPDGRGRTVLYCTSECPSGDKAQSVTLVADESTAFF
ncbi:uncharacterized protein SAPINGB_P004562 [Magnusiomyces paraingens]|uniref:Hyphally-regulated cell wall protein N-terminal domain-containing protein n=1 Tax=Magnusiomyces paraingens TaxID=2606893 RepID=A0A5E8BXL8_9ASCO|nr:uncharacterized protein SAPINGB_P004562 [Saprochaete ingens]VVT55369.1 unnamed protein product [Saprochaete ingens]